MKLNLLPANVSRGRQSRTAWVISILFALLSIGLAAALIIKSDGELTDAKLAYEQAKPAADHAVETANKADTIMGSDAMKAMTRNVALSQAMISHNDVYPDLYNKVKQFIPPFYRLTSLSATPSSDSQATVVMVGTLKTFQQYADLMLVLMRNPDAVSISRSGFTGQNKIVPNLTTADQVGRPRFPSEQTIPDDALERLSFFESQGSTPSYSGIGNFGSGTDQTRNAMPDDSLVTVQILINANLQTPNPRASLGPATAAAGGPAGAAPGAAAVGAPAGVPAAGATPPAPGAAGPTPGDR